MPREEHRHETTRHSLPEDLQICNENENQMNVTLSQRMWHKTLAENESAPDDEGTGKGSRRYDREPADDQQPGRASPSAT